MKNSCEDRIVSLVPWVLLTGAFGTWYEIPHSILLTVLTSGGLLGIACGIAYIKESVRQTIHL